MAHESEERRPWYEKIGCLLQPLYFLEHLTVRFGGLFGLGALCQEQASSGFFLFALYGRTCLVAAAARRVVYWWCGGGRETRTFAFFRGCLVFDHFQDGCVCECVLSRLKS